MQEMCFIVKFLHIYPLHFVLFTPLIALHILPLLLFLVHLPPNSPSAFHDTYFLSPTLSSYPPFGLLPSISKFLPTFTHMYIHTQIYIPNMTKA